MIWAFEPGFYNRHGQYPQAALMANGSISLLDTPTDVIAFTRASHDGSCSVTCAFNFSNETQQTHGLTLTPWSAAFQEM